LGAARPFAVDIADQYITADTPEVVIGQGIVTSQEASSSFPTTNTQTLPVHISINAQFTIAHALHINQCSANTLHQQRTDRQLATTPDCMQDVRATVLGQKIAYVLYVDVSSVPGCNHRPPPLVTAKLA